MKFRYTIFYVKNVKETLMFYHRAFGFAIRFLHESEDYGELETGDTLLSFSSISLMEQLGKSPGTPNPANPVFEIAFETDDVERAVKQALKAGATLVQDIRDEDWGQITAYVCDPNGYLIEICSPVKVEPQS